MSEKNDRKGTTLARSLSAAQAPRAIQPTSLIDKSSHWNCTYVVNVPIKNLHEDRQLDFTTLSKPTPTAARRYSTLLLIFATLLLNSACSVFGVESVAEAPYQSVLKENEFEVRDYASFVVAETRVDDDYKKAGNSAFRRLFAYISGDNEASDKIAMTAPVIAETGSVDSSEKIAMTAPVTSQQDGDTWLYRFVLPKSYTIDNAPRPLNPDVIITETEPQRVATIRYSGRATDKSRARNTQALINWIEQTGLEQESEPRWAGYNSPWALPPFRRNEVLIDVSTK